MNTPAFVFPVPCTKPGPEGKVIESIGIYRFLKIHVEQTVQQTFIDFTPPPAASGSLLPAAASGRAYRGHFHLGRRDQAACRCEGPPSLQRPALSQPQSMCLLLGQAESLLASLRTRFL